MTVNHNFHYEQSSDVSKVEKEKGGNNTWFII